MTAAMHAGPSSHPVPAAPSDDSLLSQALESIANITSIAASARVALEKSPLEDGVLERIINGSNLWYDCYKQHKAKFCKAIKALKTDIEARCVLLLVHLC